MKKYLAIGVAAIGVIALAAPAAFASTVTVTGSLTTSDPTTTGGRLFRNGVTSTCAAPKANPGNLASNGNYDTHTFTNTSTSAQCVTVEFTHTCTTSVHSFATTGFLPSNPSAGYLGDQGSSISGLVYSFNAPPSASFDVVVISNFVGFTGCANYTLSVDGTGILKGKLPTSKDQCLKDGWKSFDGFKTQGDCVSFVATGFRNLAAG